MKLIERRRLVALLAFLLELRRRFEISISRLEILMEEKVATE